MASTVWRGYITFGLISVPVRLFRAARAERVGLRRLYRSEATVEPELLTNRRGATGTNAPEQIAPTLPRNGSGSRSVIADKEPDLDRSFSTSASAQPILMPVKQASVRQGSEELVPEQKVVKGYEYEKGRYVALEAEELKNLAPKTSAGMEIQEFVALSDIDPVFFETSYYVMPEEAGEKAYALLYKSMQTTGLVAVAQFAMHSREHVVVLRPGKTGLLAHTMFFTSEVRGDKEHRADLNLVADKELGLAETLIRSLAAPFEPEKYRDTYRERLESMIASKVKGEPVTAAAAPQRSAEVVDIAEALRRSLANLKKPATSAAKSESAKSASEHASQAAPQSGAKKTARRAAQK